MFVGGLQSVPVGHRYTSSTEGARAFSWRRYEIRPLAASSRVYSGTGSLLALRVLMQSDTGSLLALRVLVHSAEDHKS